MGVALQRMFGCVAMAGVLLVGCRNASESVNRVPPLHLDGSLDADAVAALTEILGASEWDQISIPPLILKKQNARVQAVLADGTVVVSESEKLDAAVEAKLVQWMAFTLAEACDPSYRVPPFLQEMFDQAFLADLVEVLLESSSDANRWAIADIMKAWETSPGVVIERDRADAPSVRVRIPESSRRAIEAYLEDRHAATRPASAPTDPK